MNNITYQESTIMKVSDVLQYLKISRGILMKLPIKKLKIRRRTFYRKEDIDQFILDNLIEVKYDFKSK